MGNTSNRSSALDAIQIPSISPRSQSLIKAYGHGVHPKTIRRATKRRVPTLRSLYPYLTYFKELNPNTRIHSSNSIPFIANVICSYTGTNNVHFSTFNLNIPIHHGQSRKRSYHPPNIHNPITLCGASWNGLLFKQSEPTAVFNYDTNQYQLCNLNGWRDERVVALWRQNVDGFALTNKGNLFGIRITRNGTFQMEKLQSFKMFSAADFGTIGNQASNFVRLLCWFDVRSGRLMVIRLESEKTKDHRSRVFFSLFGEKSYHLKVSRKLQSLMDRHFIQNTKTFLFRHKPSSTWLLMFAGYIVQFALDFVKGKLKIFGIGKICNFEPVMALETIYEVSASNAVLRTGVDHTDNGGLVRLMQKIKGGERTVTECIIGWDELRSCIIVNVGECRKGLETLYRAKIYAVFIGDLNIKWNSVQSRRKA